MKKIVSVLSLILLSTSFAYAKDAKPAASVVAPVTHGDLYASCVRFGNISNKDFRPKWESEAQRKELEPLELKTLAEGCLCIVDVAFKTLPKDIIQGYNKSLNGPHLTSIKEIKKVMNSKAYDWMSTFLKDGMIDKVAACNETAMKADGEKKMIDKAFSEKKSN